MEVLYYAVSQWTVAPKRWILSEILYIITVSQVKEWLISLEITHDNVSFINI